MKVDPVKQHTWLRKFLGEWTSECTAMCGPEGSAQTTTGTESVRTLGDVWIIGEGRGEMPGGGEAQMVRTLGYDPSRERFVGTWIGSMMTHLWIYNGQLDAAGKVLTLHCEGPNFEKPGAMCRYRDVHEIISDNERTLTAFVQGEDGSWTQIMTATYRRKK